MAEALPFFFLILPYPSTAQICALRQTTRIGHGGKYTMDDMEVDNEHDVEAHVRMESMAWRWMDKDDVDLRLR